MRQVRGLTLKVTGAPRQCSRPRRHESTRPVDRRVGRHGALDWCSLAAAGVPKREHFDATAADSIVKVIMNPRQVNTAHAREAGVSRDGTNARLPCDQGEGALQFLGECTRSRGTIKRPPTGSFRDLRRGAARDSDREGTQVRRRSPERSSSPETVSPRSASPIASSNATSISGVTSNDSSSSRASTVTLAPSAKTGSSNTTLPPTIFPEATFMRQMVLLCRGRVELTMTPNVQGNRRAALVRAEDQSMSRRLRLTVRLGIEPSDQRLARGNGNVSCPMPQTRRRAAHAFRADRGTSVCA